MAIRKPGGRLKSWQSLKNREDVWRLHWKGLSQRDIAAGCCLSRGTVRHYLSIGPPPGVNPPKWYSAPGASVTELRPRSGTQQQRNSDPGA